MIGLNDLVYYVVFLLIAALVAGLLWWLINYCEAQFPGAPFVFKIVRILFVILIVLVLISLLMSLIGFPLIRLDRQPAAAR